MTIDKYKAICAIVKGFCEACPACEVGNAALGAVIAIAAIIKQEGEHERLSPEQPV